MSTIKTIVAIVCAVAIAGAAFFSYRHGKQVGVDSRNAEVTALNDALTLQRAKTQEAAFSCFEKATQQVNEIYEANQQTNADIRARSDVLGVFIDGLLNNVPSAGCEDNGFPSVPRIAFGVSEGTGVQLLDTRCREAVRCAASNGQYVYEFQNWYHGARDMYMKQLKSIHEEVTP